MSIFENPFKKAQKSQEAIDEKKEVEAAAPEEETRPFRSADSHGAIHSADSQQAADKLAAEANRTY